MAKISRVVEGLATKKATEKIQDMKKEKLEKELNLQKKKIITNIGSALKELIPVKKSDPSKTKSR